MHVFFTFTFRAFGRRFYPKRLTKSTFVEGIYNISLWYLKIRIELFSSIPIYETNRTSFISYSYFIFFFSGPSNYHLEASYKAKFLQAINLWKMGEKEKMVLEMFCMKSIH